MRGTDVISSPFTAEAARYHQVGQLEQVQEMSRRALRANPGDAMALLGLVQAHCLA